VLVGLRWVKRGRTGLGSGASDRGRCRLGSGMAGVVRSGVGHGWGGSSGAHGSDAREREKREIERVGPDTVPTYVRWANTSVDKHKRSGLRGCRWCLMFIGRTSVFKPMNII
jgi:hypothetical protein